MQCEKRNNMNKVTFLFLLLVFTSCRDFELPKSKHNDGLYNRGNIDFVELEIKNSKVHLNKTEIENLIEIQNHINVARDTSRADDISAILYIDKDCNYLRVDSIIRKLRESAIHRFNFKTNSINDSSYIHLMYGPVGGFYDSLDYQILNTSKLERDSLNILIVNKQSKKSYNVNDSILDKEELKQRLKNTMQNSIKCIYIINPGIENTISDVIEMTDIYNLILNEKRERYALTMFGQSYKEIEDSIRWEINRRRFTKIINILPQKIENTAYNKPQ